MIFRANYVSMSDEDGAFVLGFADDEVAPSRYVLLERAVEPDEQERKLGLDRARIEVDDQSRSVYCNALEGVLSKSRMMLKLDHEAATKLGIDEVIEIQLPAQYQELSAIEAACKKLFGEEFFQLDDEL